MLICDNRSIRIIDKNDINNLFTQFEQKAKINNATCFKDTGMIVYSCEQPKIGAIFIPQLGPSPPFCTFLENMTEELEENKREHQINDYKFMTYEEIVQLDGEYLIKEGRIQAHLHGF